MRAVDRTRQPGPKVLTDPSGRGATELAKARAHMADPVARIRAFPFAAYKDEAVKAALLALFHGKCAYCESYYRAQAPVDVEHFRPKGAVEGAPDHPGYWWLGMAWANLLPSCIDCNRRRRQETPAATPSLTALHDAAEAVVNTGKKDAFPVAGPRATAETDDLMSEQALLLDPTQDRPEDHLEFHLDPAQPLALILPKRSPGAPAALPTIGTPEDIAAAAAAAGVSVRGAVSIQVYGLNRLGLVQDRTRVLRRLEFLRHLIARIDGIAADLSRSRAKAARAAVPQLELLIDAVSDEIAGMAEPDQPFSALVRQWIDTYADELSS